VPDKDLLGRRALARALADKLYDHVTGPEDTDPGPTVVTIEGPWGSGKSTLMDLVRDFLPAPRTSAATPPRLTVRHASRLLRDGASTQAPVRETGSRGVVTAWFNPWAHQSGEQVWAGLVAEIIEAARPVLYPSETARERYWFVRNLSRVDRYALRRTLHRRMLSPSLTLGALGVVASLVIAIAELETTVQLLGAQVATAIVALLIASTFLLLGAVHTAGRYFTGAAVRFLPGELFHGPVSMAPDIDAPEPGLAEGLNDPLRRARAGLLYLYQHDVSELVTDLDLAGYELIVFVDDLDRCRALTTAEVFEAINLFLAGFVAERRRTGHHRPGEPGSSLRARFVIGLDPVVVASHLDRIYTDIYDPDTALDEEDPSRGWAFLRKLVHLPILVPQIPDAEIFRIADLISGAPITPAPEPVRAERKPVGATRWRPRQDPEVRALVHSRLAARPDRSIREAARQLHLWDFYERVLAATRPCDDPVAERTRSQQLIILAEIVTRWPALQRFLHRRTGAHTGLQRLALAARRPEWAGTVGTVLTGHGVSDETIAALEELLGDHGGADVADLATQVL
jgi:hypothetical protein